MSSNVNDISNKDNLESLLNKENSNKEIKKDFEEVINIINNNNNLNNQKTIKNNPNANILLEQKEEGNKNINDIETREIIDINEDNNNSKHISYNINNINNKIIIKKNRIEGDNSQDNISRSMSSGNNSKSNFSNSPSISRSRSRSKSSSKSKKIYQNVSTGKNFGNKFIDRKMRHKPKNSIKIFEMRNGCCPKCMKAFSSNGKSCLCQVPIRERRLKLPEEGCNYCGCKGCNPIDIKHNERIGQKRILIQDRTITHKNERILDSEDESLQINDKYVDNYNRDKKHIKQDLDKSLGINSTIYGFGVPLRTPSYILGYTPIYENNHSDNYNFINMRNYDSNNTINNKFRRNNYNNSNNNFNNINNSNINNNINMNFKRNDRRFRK